MLKSLKILLMSVTPEEETQTCFYCPLKWHCVLWLWNKWNVNLPVCSCTDLRLINVDNVLEINMELLKEWVKNNPKSYIFKNKTD